ncbi:hypothetical protein HOH87_05115 [bacterium]|jgi:hypothetical protein|nr:hypothetical protein [bacterium]
MLGIGSLGTDISSLLETINSSSGKMGLSKGDIELIQQVMNLIKMMINDGIQPNELERLGFLMEALGEMVTEDLKDAINNITKKIKELSNKLLDGDTEETTTITGAGGAHLTMNLIDGSLSAEGGEGDDPYASLSKMSGISSNPTQSKSQGKIGIPKAELLKNVTQMDQKAKDAVDIFESIMRHMTDFLMGRLTETLDKKGFLDIPTEPNPNQPVAGIDSVNISNHNPNNPFSSAPPTFGA